MKWSVENKSQADNGRENQNRGSESYPCTLVRILSP